MNNVFFVFGLGITGIGAVKHLIQMQNKVFIADDNEQSINSLLESLTKTHKEYLTYIHAITDYKTFDFLQNNVQTLILSPGVPLKYPAPHQIVKNASKQRINITTDINLYTKTTPSTTIGVTGSNGKSTVTHLLGSIFKQNTLSVNIFGNIGVSPFDHLHSPASQPPASQSLVSQPPVSQPPVSQLVHPQSPNSQIPQSPQSKNSLLKDSSPNDSNNSISVIEISSFQLESSKIDFDYTALTNISQDHIERSGGFCNYINLKKSILLNSSGYNIINISDKICNDIYQELKNKDNKNKLIPISLSQSNSNQIQIDQIQTPPNSAQSRPNLKHEYTITPQGRIFKNQNLLSTLPQDIKIIGQHNLLNILAAFAICDIMGLKSDKIIKAIQQTEPLQHRLNLVHTPNPRIKFYNDSKATNAESTIAGINSFQNNEDIYLILGGILPTGQDALTLLNNLPTSSIKQIKHIATIGQDGSKIKNNIDEYNQNSQSSKTTSKPAVNINSTHCKTLETAFNHLHSLAQKTTQIASQPDSQPASQPVNQSVSQIASQKANQENTQTITSAVILLSPMCKSFDQFKNFKERGEKFLELCQK